MARSPFLQLERTLNHATRFVEEVRSDIERAWRDSADLPPRIRSVHETPGHTTPEFRTLSIPIPPAAGSLPVEVLSGLIAHYAEEKRPDRLLLALEAEMDGGPILIAEARDRGGSRLFWLQPFSRLAGEITWGEPRNGGWCDPGDQEMILDESFLHLPAPRVPVHRAAQRVPGPPQLTAR